jgi:molybdenum cofactor cytidylyltransferase
MAQCSGSQPVLVVLAAGRGSRFGKAPRCVQPVCGRALARHSIEAFRRDVSGPVVCLMNYRQDEVVHALADDLAYVHSDNPVGGRAYATYETLCIGELEDEDALLVV